MKEKELKKRKFNEEKTIRKKEENLIEKKISKRRKTLVYKEEK